MIKALVHFSGSHPKFVIATSLFLSVLGFFCFQKMSFDALPDLSESQVIVYSQWDQAPEVIDTQISRPLVSSLLGIKNVKSVRATIDYGSSFIFVIFEDGENMDVARSRVLERVNQIRKNLPREAEVEIGPDSTSLGWIYQYALVDSENTQNLADLRAFHDLGIKLQLQAIPGVAEVASVGGFEKQIHIKLEPSKMALYNVGVDEVVSHLMNTSRVKSARTIEYSGAEAIVRTRGQLSLPRDFENLAVAFQHQTRRPIFLRQIGTVEFGSDMRRGVTNFNGTPDVVGGIVLARQGADIPSTLKRIKARVEEIQKTLPGNLKIETTYDRTGLIERALNTLRSTLLEELIIVAFVILLFLMHLPSALVPIVTIPASVLIAFIPLYLLGVTSNIMLLSGIAISIGVLVDGAIIEVENAYRRIQQWNENGRREDFFKVRIDALAEVSPSVFLSLITIAFAFLPVMFLVGQEGKLFTPLALSKNVAMFVAAILSVTLDPAARMMFSRIRPFQTKSKLLNWVANRSLIGSYTKERESWLNRFFISIYEPVIRFALSRPYFTVGTALSTLVLSFYFYSHLGREFMPPMKEGSVLYMPSTPPGLSVTKAKELLANQSQILMDFPEVKSVFGKAGRANTATDNAPLSMIETNIEFKPEVEWRKKERFYSEWPEIVQIPLRRFWSDRISEDELLKEMNAALKFPGVGNVWTTPIQGRVDMLATGIRTPVGVKVFGNNVAEIEKVSVEIESMLRDLDGTRSVIAERVSQGYYLDIDFDHQKLAQIGLSLDDAQTQVSAAVGGQFVSDAFLGGFKLPILVRLSPDYRQNAEAIRHIPLRGPAGSFLAVDQVSKVEFSQSPAMMRSENAQLINHVYVDVDLAKTSLGDYVERAKRKVEAHLTLPEGVFVQWAGRYENLFETEKRLLFVIPFVLVVILSLIYFNTGSWVKTGMVMTAVPFSLVGAFGLLFFLDYNISAATWIGIIALLGLDAETGVFMLMYLDMATRDRQNLNRLKTLDDLREGIVEGSARRMRPKLMTVSALLLGLTPMMWSVDIGSEVLKRIAAPMIGGLATSFLFELLLFPVLFMLWKRTQLRLT